MAGEDDINFRLTADGSPARREIGSVYDLLKKLDPAAGAAGKSLDELGSGGIRSLREYATTIERVDALLDNLETRQMRNASRRIVSSNTSALSTSNTNTGIQVNGQRAALAAQNTLNAATRQEISLREQANRDLITQSRQTLIAAQTEQVANRQRIDSVREAQRVERQLAQERERAARVQAQSQRALAAAQEAAWRSERSNAIARERLASNPAVGAGTERTSALSSERASSVHDVDQINATRYALYDVAQTATIVGTAIAGVGAASVVAATQAETSFANTRRAMDATAQEAEPLRRTLLDLTTQMPTSFSDVAGVAQLGAQLGIANSSLDSFSESVVKFSATTNVSTEAAGTAFGRLSQLLKVPATEFENLSSSIYKVGIESVATESEIISTSTQIAGAAAAYNFTADQVVGLSAAFASLGIAPEAARGSVTRIFGDIEKAVSAGGPELQAFADLLGITSEEASTLWKSDPSQFFTELVDGLSQSKDLLGDLSSIGANDVRDVNLLQRLAKNSDFLAQSLKSSKSAYDDGTATSEGYAIVADTLAAKLQVLLNTFKELAINAGTPLLGALGGAVDLLSAFVGLISNANPTVLAVVTVLALLVGGFVLLKGAQAAAMAGILALRFVLQQLGETGGVTGLNMASLRSQIALLRAEMGMTATAANTTTGAIGRSGAAATTSRLSFLSMSNVMKGIGWAGAIAGAVQLSNQLLAAYYSSKQAAAGLQDIQKATYAVSTDKLVESFKKAKSTLDNFADGYNGRKGADQQGLYRLSQFAATTFGNEDTGTKNAKAELEAIDQQLAQIVSKGNGKQAAAAIDQMGLSAARAREQFPAYAAAVKTAEEAQRAQGGAAGDAAQETDAYGNSLNQAGINLDGLFSSLTGGDMGAAVQQLFSSIYDIGDSFSYISANGRTNLGYLQSAMESVIASGQQTGLSATDSVSVLFTQMAKKGVDTDALLRMLANTPIEFRGDIDLSAVQKKIAAVMAGGSFAAPGSKKFDGFLQLNTSISTMATTAPKAANGLSGVGKAAKEAADKSKDAAKEIKTLNDYANDLSGVFSDARTYRFGVQDALDDVQTKWIGIRGEIDDNNKALAEHKKDISDARYELAGYRSDLRGLQSQLSSQRYFLKIAVQYGDDLRANEIRANMDDLQSQIRDKNKDIAGAQKDASAGFTGNTKTIIQQRQSLGELYEAYEKAIAEYARSGMSQDQLAIKTEELRKDFVRQATQAGYSRAEIDKYSRAFSDLTRIINGVPRKITIDANIGPAERALREFLLKANAAKAKPSVDSPGAGAAGRNAGIKFTSNFDQWMAEWQNSFNGTKRALDAITREVDKIKIPDTRKLLENIGKNFAGGGFVPGKSAFPVGGYVPGSAPQDRRRDNVLGFVQGGGAVSLQGGEPIMTNAARAKYGDGMFDAINGLRFQPTVVRPQVTVQGAGGSGYTELSPTDRAIFQLIADRVGVSISSSALEKSLGAANTAANRRRTG